MGKKKAASAKEKEKTNVVRLLEQKKVPYEMVTLPGADGLTGEEIASLTGENPAQAFKTLVTTGKTGAYYVFVIPVNAELDLKKAAKAAGEKSIAMLKQKNLLPLTGYVHGGCSPIGMKKAFPTFFDQSAQNFSAVYFSAGKIGHQVKVPVEKLSAILPVTFRDLIKEA